MNIHVKVWDMNFPDDKMEEIVGLVRKYDCEKQVYFMTINDEIIKKVMAYAPDISVCVGWDRNQDPLSIVKRAIALGAPKVQLYKPYFNQESVDLAHAHGIICNVFWSDDPEEARRFRDMGIDCILTNDYLRIKNALETTEP
ncbi:MAG: glycerophosphodiester phosphodiesterase, partial [Clostridia bacterium]|nr:glycerophosphodiester phosphodiesterase [Clostridia bacterium]